MAKNKQSDFIAIVKMLNIGLIRFALPISMPRFKSITLYQNISKIKLFLQKNAKFSSAGKSAPRPPKQPSFVDFWLRACITHSDNILKG